MLRSASVCLLLDKQLTVSLLLQCKDNIAGYVKAVCIAVGCLYTCTRASTLNFLLSSSFPFPLSFLSLLLWLLLLLQLLLPLFSFFLFLFLLLFFFNTFSSSSSVYFLLILLLLLLSRIIFICTLRCISAVKRISLFAV